MSKQKKPRCFNCRKKLGILKATKKASAITVDPRNLAINISLTKPKMRLRNV